MSSLGRIVVGISGASCTGKTTLTKLLKATFPWASVVHQDAYYYPNDPKYHVYLPDIKHFNWDLKTAVDFPQMEKDLHLLISQQQNVKVFENNYEPKKEKLLCFPNDVFVRDHSPQETEVRYLISRFSSVPLTILEGHIIFSHQPFFNLCKLKYFLTLEKDELFERRHRRVYDPPNPPGYLEKYVWPAYHSRFDETKKLPGIHFYNAKTVPLVGMYRQIKQSITLELAKMISPTPKLKEVDAKVKADRQG